jgi:NCAIR mutase (PurE)-related protein
VASKEWIRILEQVARGEIAPADAEARCRAALESDLGFARLDLDRVGRCGQPEVVFCPGKTAAQVIRIFRELAGAGQNALATRATPELARALLAEFPDACHHETARCVTRDVTPPLPLSGGVAVVTAGTADVPVAEEAALVAERMGAKVDRIYDVGVAGLHRLVRHLDRLRSARALVVVAGMEGALPSVVGGLVSVPVVAVPTSVGYGTHLGGLTPLLAMLNSCAAGVTVVNIDNGFGAGVAAARINRAGERGA